MIFQRIKKSSQKWKSHLMSEGKVLILFSGWKISTTRRPPKVESGAEIDEGAKITGLCAGKLTGVAG